MVWQVFLVRIAIIKKERSKHMKKTRWLSVVLALVLVFSLCASAFAVDEQASADSAGRLLDSLENPRSESLIERFSGMYKPGDQVRVVVLTESEPTAENSGLIQRIINTDGKLLREHASVMSKMERKQVGYTVNHEYTALLNGMSLTIDFADLDTVAALPGVKAVFIPTQYRLPEEQPNSSAASEMINAMIMNDVLSADGSGKLIAILDTGITARHEAFKVYDGMLQTPAYTKTQMIKAIADIGHGKYYSQKVPYQFDYADQDNDATDDHSGHGSHVAGIAAGYVATSEGEITFRGSAPDAQILAMKIFPSDKDTTSSDIYFAALEDAYKLGADVINMSIGSPNGFSYDNELEDEVFGNIYARLEEAGVIVCASAGNEASMAEYAQNWTGGGYVTSGYADYGVLGNPASYDGNVAVAAVENYEFPAYLIQVGDEGFPYRDHDGSAFHDKFSGKNVKYVMVPDLGVAEAYENLDVSGKVAVVSRGEITFEEKVAYASAAGASGVVVYNNQPGELVTMAVDTNTIPAVFVSQECGAALQANAEQKFHVDKEPTVVENPAAGSMATFSSWGPTNDLQIKPTISGVGGNVNSVSAGTKKGYEVMSGTSMSAPNVTGGYASLLEALTNDNPDLTKAEAAAIARNAVLSHAFVLTNYWDDDGNGNIISVPYSPRQQGAGLMDIANAYLASLVITDPLVELGDDPARKGVYTIKSELTNTSDVEQTYDVSVKVLADAVAGGNYGTADEPDYHFYNAMASVLLEQGVDYTRTGAKKVTLAPGETKTVSVKIKLTDDAKQGYLDTFFENGAFVEGYVTFSNDSETAHSTFLAFYGDWSEGPILETHDWRELMDLENPGDYVNSADWEIDTVPSMAYLVDDEYNPQLYLGDAPFGYPEGGAYSAARIAVSNDADSAYFTNLLVVPTTIRNARHIIMIAHNADTGEIYFVDDAPYCTKTIFDPEEGGFSSYAWFAFNGMDSYSGEEPVPVADDTNVVLAFYANLPYGEDVLGSMTPEQIVADGAQYLEYTVPVVVDSAVPVIEDYTYDPETGVVTATVTDNQFLAAVYAVDAEGNDLAEPLVFADDAAGESHTITLNVGEQESFYLAAMDYATNEGAVLVTPPHDHDWSDWTVVTEPTCTEEGEQCRVCQICGKEELEPIDKLPHTLTAVAEVPATCEEAGVAAYWKCDVCEKLFSDAEGKTEIEAPAELAALGHAWDEGVVTKHPTVAGPGEVLYTCQNDPSHTKTEPIDKLYDCDGGEFCPSKDFVDVNRGPKSWSHEPIDWAVLTGVTNGTTKTTFSPNSVCTRAQAVTFLWRAAGCPEPSDMDTPFKDVTLDSWYAKAVLWAVEQGITNGTSKTMFSPEETCTRAQIVTFLWRMEGKPEAKTANGFKDVPTTAYYAGAVDWAVEQGITNGESATQFMPSNGCTRAQIVTFLFRQFGN